MSNAQLLALAIFAVVVVALSVGMMPASRRLNGSQKYRAFRRPGKDLDPQTNRWQSIPPVLAFLSLFSGGSSSAGSDHTDASDAGGGDSGGDAGADGGGGE